MWVITGVLLGLVVLAAILGFHAGPHAHLLGGVLGACAAVLLIVLAVQGRADALLWVLLAGDLTLSAGVGVLAWRGLVNQPGGRLRSDNRALAGNGTTGVAVSDLDPDGIVRVQGEHWSARAVNGPIRSGTAVQVVGRDGVRLDVWGDELPPGLTGLGAVNPAEER